MSKRKFADFCNRLFWHIIYLFPLILIVILSIPTDANVVDSSLFSIVFENIGITSDNFISNLFSSVGAYFDSNIFVNGTLLNYYLTYLTICVLFRCLYEVMVFVPKFALKFVERCVD